MRKKLIALIILTSLCLVGCRCFGNLEQNNDITNKTPVENTTNSVTPIENTDIHKNGDNETTETPSKADTTSEIDNTPNIIHIDPVDTDKNNTWLVSSKSDAEKIEVISDYYSGYSEWLKVYSLIPEISITKQSSQTKFSLSKSLDFKETDLKLSLSKIASTLLKLDNVEYIIETTDSSIELILDSNKLTDTEKILDVSNLEKSSNINKCRILNNGNSEIEVYLNTSDIKRDDSLNNYELALLSKARLYRLLTQTNPDFNIAVYELDKSHRYRYEVNYKINQYSDFKGLWHGYEYIDKENFFISEISMMQVQDMGATCKISIPLSQIKDTTKIDKLSEFYISIYDGLFNNSGEFESKYNGDLVFIIDIDTINKVRADLNEQIAKLSTRENISNISIDNENNITSITVKSLDQNIVYSDCYQVAFLNQMYKTLNSKVNTPTNQTNQILAIYDEQGILRYKITVSPETGGNLNSLNITYNENLTDKQIKKLSDFYKLLYNIEKVETLDMGYRGYDEILNKESRASRILGILPNIIITETDELLSIEFKDLSLSETHSMVMKLGDGITYNIDISENNQIVMNCSKSEYETIINKLNNWKENLELEYKANNIQVESDGNLSLGETNLRDYEITRLSDEYNMINKFITHFSLNNTDTTDTETVENGTVENGTVENGTVENGTVENGSKTDIIEDEVQK